MRRYPTLTLIVSAAALLAALVLLYLARHAPREWGWLRIDAAGTLHLVAATGGIVLRLLTLPAELRTIPMRVWCILALIVAAVLLPYTGATATAYLLIALLIWQPAVRMWRSAPIFLFGGAAAGAGIAIGYGLLAFRGVLRIDDPLAGAALDSTAFAAILAGVAGALLLPEPWPRQTDSENRASPHAHTGLLRAMWLLPLMQLYSLGPWNTGWSLATLLLAGAALLHAAGAALTSRNISECHAHILRMYRALALAGLGLSTSGGIAAAGYALLLLAVWSAAVEPLSEPADPGNQFIRRLYDSAVGLTPWLVSPAFPLSGAFVAFWMLLGAATAGGISLLGGVAWLAALIAAVALILPGRGRASPIPAIAMLALGIGVPLVLRLMIQPAVEQLQGGLTVYGDVQVWPWIGLTMVDSARRQVLSWPALGVAGMMLIIAALVFLLRRYPALFGPPGDPQVPPADRSAQQVLADLRTLLPFGPAHSDAAQQPGSANSEESRRDGD